MRGTGVLQVLLKEPRWAMGLTWLAILIFVEAISFVPDPSPCIVQIEGYQRCAPAHVVILSALHGATNWIEANDKGIVAVASLIIAFFTITLWRSTDEMKKVTQAVHEATIAGQRAYVSVFSPHYELQLDSEHRVIGLRLRVTWKNSGTTPASPTVAMIGATWVSSVDQFEFGRIAQEGIKEPIVLGPGAEIQSGTVDISAVHVLANIKGEGHQFLWGWARYRDIFPDSAVHVVEFCFRVNIEDKLGPTPFSGRVTFSFHGEHNRYYNEPLRP